MRRILVPFLFLLLAASAGSEDRLVIIWEAPAEGANVLMSELSSPDLDLRLFAGGSVVRLPNPTGAGQAFFGRSRAIVFGSHDRAASLEEGQVFKAPALTALYDDALKSRGAVFVRLDKLQTDALLRDDAVNEDNSADRDSF
jgi:hypothetical protein